MGLLLWCMWSTFHILSRSVVFYVYGSVHPWSILIIVQRDATQSSLFIFNCSTRCNTKQSIYYFAHCTCFGCQPHPSSGIHKTVTAASGTVQLPPSKVAKLGHVGGRYLHKKYDQYRRLQVLFCVLLLMGVVKTRNM